MKLKDNSILFSLFSNKITASEQPKPNSWKMFLENLKYKIRNKVKNHVLLNSFNKQL